MYVLHNDEYMVGLPSEEGFSFIVVNEGCDPDCPYCQERLIANDWNIRCCRNLDGTMKKYMVEDRRCVKCGRMHRLLPDFLVPYKRYGREAIEEMIFNDIDDTLTKYPDTSNEYTIKRYKKWWLVMEPYFLAVMLSLTEKLGSVCRKAVSFRETVRAIANSCNWTFPSRLDSFTTRLGFTPG